jgi:hypothetical protein
MTGGEDDSFECPDWYPLIRSSRYLNARPWELLSRSQAGLVPPRLWLLWAQIAQAAESEAEAALHKSQKPKKK